MLQTTDPGQHGPQKNGPPPPWSNPNVSAWAAKLRPLSDIRELTEPSLIDSASRNSELFRAHTIQPSGSLGRKDGLQRANALARNGSQRSIGRSGHTAVKMEITDSDQPLDAETQSDHSSAYSLSLENVPSRSLPRHRLDVPPRERSAPLLRVPDTPNTLSQYPFVSIPPPRGMGFTIPSHGPSCSPIKKPPSKLDMLSHGHGRPYKGLRTFIRTINPNIDILDYPAHRHPRLVVDLQVGSSLFVGGASINGNIRITVNQLERSRHKRQLAISRISVDLLGIEEASGGKRAIFINLASELLDSENPPPHGMVDSLKQISSVDPFWHLAPSISTLPFSLSLPLDVGPTPFHSKHARIRYMLAATVLIRDQGKQYLVRSSQELSVLSVYDRKFPVFTAKGFVLMGWFSRKSSCVSANPIDRIR
jgi:hypothetical protein